MLVSEATLVYRRMMRSSYTGLLFASLAASISALVGCGGAVGEVVRPNDYTGAGAIGAAPKCAGKPQYATPYVLDLPDATRASLEAALYDKKRKGVVVVSYDCTELRVLANCRLADGSYDYAGVTPQERVVQMKSADDLKTNLPLSAGKLGAELSSGRSIDLALVTIGLHSTTIERLTRGELTGACDGATHFVQNASLGAYSMATGSAGKVKAVAEVFSVGASGGSESMRSVATNAGSLPECREADSDAPTPPKRCRAPLTVQLQPIVGDDAPKPPPPPADPKAKTIEATENPCRDGYFFTNGICTKEAPTAHLCAPKDAADCKVQCERGSFESCYNFALTMPYGTRSEPLTKACDNGVAKACGQLGHELRNYDAPKDAPINVKAKELMQRGCKGGSGDSCEYLGDILGGAYPKEGEDVAAIGRAYTRGCNLGAEGACFWLGTMHMNDSGLPGADKAIGREVLDRSCAADYEPSCSSLAEAIQELPKGDPARDMERAYRSASKVCGPLKGISCNKAVEIGIEAGHAKEALSWSESTCAVWPYNCEMTGDLYAAGTGTTKNRAKAREFWAKACENGKGTKSACEKARK